MRNGQMTREAKLRTRFLNLKNWTRRHTITWLVLRLTILCLISIGFSVTFAQWWHEFGHIVVAFGAGAPITEYVFWPPWQQHVTADFSSKSILVLKLFIVDGFLITLIPLSVLLEISVLRKSNWAYVLMFPLFQTLPTSSGDLGAVGIAISPEISGFVGWTIPMVAFALLAILRLSGEGKFFQRKRKL